MRTLLLCSALSLAPIASPAVAQAVNLGGSAAQSCYQFAANRQHDIHAIAECTAALSDSGITGGDRAATYVNRGILFMLSGQHDRAMTDYDQAIALDPTQAEAWLDKAVSMVDTGRGSVAVDLADRSLKLRTQKPALAYYVRGLGHEQQGQVVAAYEDLRTAAALDPKWSEPVDQLKRYRVVPR